MQTNRSIDFELNVATVGAAIRVRIGEFGDRWVASVHAGATRTNGVGASAREALVAALAPFGARSSTAVMAAPEMFGASARLLAAATV